jgi:HAD superfamily phosphoserine phosphatase-like hydrolase
MNASPPAPPIDLVCFDVDGTLIEHPEEKVVWEVLNQYFGTPEEINRERYRRFKDGTLSYADWIALDVGDWIRVNATREQILNAVTVLRPVRGAHRTLEILRERGYLLAVISGTIDLVLDHFFPDHPFHDVYANRLEFDERGALRGWRATPFDMLGKVRALESIAGREGLQLGRCAFIGDHFNDVEVARAAGFSIAFNPKSPEIEEISNVTLRSPDLGDLLPYFPGREPDPSPSS